MTSPSDLAVVWSGSLERAGRAELELASPLLGSTLQPPPEKRARRNVGPMLQQRAKKNRAASNATPDSLRVLMWAKWRDGWSMQRIADHYGKHVVTVGRILRAWKQTKGQAA